MRRILTTVRVAALAAIAVGSTACGGASTGVSGDSAADSDQHTIVVTTNVLGDIVSSSLGDLVDTRFGVDVIMPIGADPHEFAVSAKQAEAMENADLLVVNGLGFEAGMTDIIANAIDAGTPVFIAGGTLDAMAADHTDEGDTDEGDTDAGDTADETDHDHDHGIDPHIWMDPVQIADAFDAFDEAVIEATALESATAEAVTTNVAAYTARLRELDTTIAELLADIPSERRVLVTNHDSLGWFADRYGFEVVGTVIPSVSTSAEPSAAGLEELADVIEQRGVAAIFAETTESDRLAVALSEQVGGGVAVVELYTGSLGEPGSGAETYIGFMTIDAERIAAALG